MAAELASWPIVVFGAPRSGTTYLNTLLNTHPEIYVSNEMRLFAWLHAAARRLPESNRMVNTERFNSHLETALPEVVRSFYGDVRPHARYWGDKNPFYAAGDGIGILKTVAELYPGARFLHIIRDGRDVVASLVRKRAPDGTPWALLGPANHSWMGHVDNGAAFGETRSSEDYFELRFEDLVGDDLAMAERIFAFLGIAMAQETVDFCIGEQKARTPVSGATTVGAIGTAQWRRALSVEEQLICLRTLDRHLVKYGYETEASIAALRQEIADLG